MRILRPVFSILAAVAPLISGCGEESTARPAMVDGSADAGAVAIQRFGCGTCHAIPGIKGANSTVGPPLENYARRVYVAGVLPNTPDDLVQWIRNPQAVDARTAMPDLGVSAEEARDIAAYLYERTGDAMW